jgi:hypothetical protein
MYLRWTELKTGMLIRPIEEERKIWYLRHPEIGFRRIWMGDVKPSLVLDIEIFEHSSFFDYQTMRLVLLDEKGIYCIESSGALHNKTHWEEIGS